MECVTWSASCRVEAPAMAVQSYPGKAGPVAVAAGEVTPGSVDADAALWCLHFSLSTVLLSSLCFSEYPYRQSVFSCCNLRRLLLLLVFVVKVRK